MKRAAPNSAFLLSASEQGEFVVLTKLASQAATLTGAIVGIALLLLLISVFTQTLQGSSPAQPDYEDQKETENAIQRATLAAIATVPAIDRRTLPPPEKLPPPAYLQRPAGDGRIIEGMQALDLQTTFLSTNAWIQTKSDRYTLVWAGVQREAVNGNSEQGVVIVELRSLADHQLSERNLYPTPTKAGPVVIADATGQLLTLHAADGSTFFFNVASAKYVGQGNTTLERRNGQATIAEDTTGPFSLEGALFWNRWSAPKGNNRVTVFAGIEDGDWKKGPGVGKPMLAFVVSNDAPTANDTPQVLYPAQAYGPLRVFDTMGDKVILVDSGGGVFVFDPTEQRFLDKSEVQVPIAPLFAEGTTIKP